MSDKPSPGVRIVDPAAVRDGGVAGFAQAVAAGCQPVFLPGLCRHWPAVEASWRGWEALSAYIAELDAGRMGQAFVGAPAIAGRYDYGDGPDGFNFERASLTLAQSLERIGTAADPSQASIYMGSLPVDDYAPGFAVDNPIDFLPLQARPRLWLGNASRVACHYDSFENLACVVAGRRRFTLYPPDAIGDLYVGPIDHTLAGQPTSLAAGSEPGDARYPRFAAAAAPRAIVVELEPGDALYLPKLWWHQVEALDPANVLVNYWWDAFAAGPDAPYVTMMLAMIAIAERPAAERSAWRAFFDHYVFRPEGHPLAHLPAERHGLLGPLASGNYGRIRALAMKLLRGG